MSEVLDPQKLTALLHPKLLSRGVCYQLRFKVTMQPEMACLGSGCKQYSLLHLDAVIPVSKRTLWENTVKLLTAKYRILGICVNFSDKVFTWEFKSVLEQVTGRITRNYNKICILDIFTEI